MESSFRKIAAAVPRVCLADPDANAIEMIRLLNEAAGNGAGLVVFPKDALTGATCGDLMKQTVLREAACRAAEKVYEAARQSGVAAVICQDDYPEGITIVQDAQFELVTAHEKRARKFAEMSRGGFLIYCSAGYGESTQDGVCAGDAMIFKDGRLLASSERFSTCSQIICANTDDEGVLIDTTPVPDTLKKHPFVPECPEELAARCKEVMGIQTTGIMRRMEHIHCKTAINGISGGLDSTLALLVVCKAADRLGWDRKQIIAVTMPGFGTTDRTHDNAWALMQALGVSCREISIAPSVTQHFIDINHDMAVHDATYENGQARERTQILMDLANQENGFVVGTGDLSELALGWATFNGDHMSMYDVNCDVPKTMMQAMVRWAADNDFSDVKDTLLDIVDTPISPELIPEQKTEDLVGPYELHDFFLYHFIRHGRAPREILALAMDAFGGAYDKDTITKWLRTFLKRFFSQQFKRSCSADGPRIGSVCLSPRGAWAMPSDANSTTWLKDLD